MLDHNVERLAVRFPHFKLSDSVQYFVISQWVDKVDIRSVGVLLSVLKVDVICNHIQGPSVSYIGVIFDYIKSYMY